MQAMLGSVRQMTNTLGEVTLARAYRPFGETLSDVGADSIYGFTGEQTDPTGLQYLRARYYAPGVGRFLTRDAWEGDENRPMSYNGWLYGYANPIRYTDPTGYCSNPYTSSDSLPIVCFDSGPAYTGPVKADGSLNTESNAHGFLSLRELTEDIIQWTPEEKRIFENAALAVGRAFARVFNDIDAEVCDLLGQLPYQSRAVDERAARQAFLAVYGEPVNFIRTSGTSAQEFARGADKANKDATMATWISNYNSAVGQGQSPVLPAFDCCVWGYTTLSTEIWIFANAKRSTLLSATNSMFPVHELGHAFEARINGKGICLPSNFTVEPILVVVQVSELPSRPTWFLRFGAIA